MHGHRLNFTPDLRSKYANPFATLRNLITVKGRTATGVFINLGKFPDRTLLFIGGILRFVRPSLETGKVLHQSCNIRLRFWAKSFKINRVWKSNL
jgi:hypothetical protein